MSGLSEITGLLGNIIPIQNTNRISFALRTSVISSEDTNFTELKLTLEKLKHTDSDYNTVENIDDVVDSVINSMLEVSTINDITVDVDNILNLIIHTTNKIAINNRRGLGNFIITTQDNIKNLLEYTMQDKQTQYIEKISKLDYGVDVYTCDSKQLENKILVGYSGCGSTTFDSGLILNVIEDGDALKYCIADIEGSSNYYRTINLKGE